MAFDGIAAFLHTEPETLNPKTINKFGIGFQDFARHKKKNF